jgi:hypothetical protein
MPHLCCPWAKRELNPFVMDFVNLTLVLQPSIMLTLYSFISLLIYPIFVPFSFPSTKRWRLEKFSNIMQMVLLGFTFSICPYLPSVIKSANTDHTLCCAICLALARLRDIRTLLAQARSPVRLVCVQCKCSIRSLTVTVGEILSKNCSTACSK